jgi:hypothetical protein
MMWPRSGATADATRFFLSCLSFASAPFGRCPGERAVSMSATVLMLWWTPSSTALAISGFHAAATESAAASPTNPVSAPLRRVMSPPLAPVRAAITDIA